MPDNPSITDPIPAWKSRYEGIVIRDGYAIGRVVKQLSGLPPAGHQPAQDIDRETERFRSALQQAGSDISEILDSIPSESAEKDIFRAHKMMIDDPVLKQQVLQKITTDSLSAESAWLQVIHDYHRMWMNAGMGSSMENRTSDIVDIGIRVFKILDGTAAGSENPSDGILVTRELTASDALNLDPGQIRAVLSERGNETSHSAILIRSKGIPAVFGLKDIYQNLAPGENIVVDAVGGFVYTGCTDEFTQAIRSEMDARDEFLRSVEKNSGQPAVLQNGEKVHLLANVSSTDEIESALKSGCEGVGLFRTEFLYYNRMTPPAEEEHFEVYKKAVSLVQGRKIIFRTGDFGGDKPIGYLQMPVETNPFLGLRGIRFSLQEQTLLETQLRAMIRASEFGPVQIMFPMISTVDEIHEVKNVVSRLRNDLEAQGYTIGDIGLGVMIEVPSAVLHIEDILEIVDFVSIGTNDLIQYVMAADRTHDGLKELISGYQPAVLRMIKTVIEAANSQGKPVAICGEMAGDPAFTLLLAGFGLREFSMSGERIPVIKNIILQEESSGIEELLSEFKKCKTAKQVQHLLG